MSLDFLESVLLYGCWPRHGVGLEGREVLLFPLVRRLAAFLWATRKGYRVLYHLGSAHISPELDGLFDTRD